MNICSGNANGQKKVHRGHSTSGCLKGLSRKLSPKEIEKRKKKQEKNRVGKIKSDGWWLGEMFRRTISPR